jgi:hypothetical protein
MNTPSLKDRIKSAKNQQELVHLLNERSNYTYASGKTRRAWVRAAGVRTAELSTVKR